ncbi:hypothetical protein ACHAXR_010165 [Thalassiosira sp. AJA248-18]
MRRHGFACSYDEYQVGKWDYNRLDVLAGEVSVPSKCVHRKFEIEKGELSEFEIAERLWGMIEG